MTGGGYVQRRAMASMSVERLVDLFDREPSCRGAVRAELTRRWNGAPQLAELGRLDVLEVPA